MKPTPFYLGALLLLPACAHQTSGVEFLPAVEVHATAETTPVGTSNADAADDPAIWRNPADPASSLIIGTDKKAGLYAYSLDGAVKNFVAAGALNNVDLISDAKQAIVIASDRTNPTTSHIALFSLRFDDPTLRPLGKVASGPGEAYGFCLQRHNTDTSMAKVTAYAALKGGTVREVMLTRGEGGSYAGRITREWKLATQIEGCVTSPRTGDLFVGEENVGIWRIRTAHSAAQPEIFTTISPENGLVADVEGLAYAANDSGPDYLIASSQGDNAYALFDADSGKLFGRFRIADGTIDGTSETDGIELALGNFGPNYPEGLFVAQDGDNPGAAQNFKLVDWRTVLKALSLPAPGSKADHSSGSTTTE